MSNNIKELRKLLNITLKEFGEAIGITHISIHRYEKGERTPSESILMLISEKFNVNMEWLKTGQGEIFKHNLQNNTIQKILENLEKMTEDDRQDILKFSMYKLSDEKYSKKVRNHTA